LNIKTVFSGCLLGSFSKFDFIGPLKPSLQSGGFFLVRSPAWCDLAQKSGRLKVNSPRNRGGWLIGLTDLEGLGGEASAREGRNPQGFVDACQGCAQTWRTQNHHVFMAVVATCKPECLSVKATHNTFAQRIKPLINGTLSTNLQLTERFRPPLRKIRSQLSSACAWLCSASSQNNALCPVKRRMLMDSAAYAQTRKLVSNLLRGQHPKSMPLLNSA